MFRSLFPDFRHAALLFRGRAARLAAIMVLILGTLSSAALAQGGDRGTLPDGSNPIDRNPGGNTNATPAPVEVIFTKLYCADESNDNTGPWDHDEPYVVIFAADLRGRSAVGQVFSEFFKDVDTGESRSAYVQIWPLSGWGQPIVSSNDYIFLVALLEWDCDGFPRACLNGSGVPGKLQSVLIPKLTAYKQAGMSRATIANNLRVDMDLAIEAARNDHDRIGRVQEIGFSVGELQVAQAGRAVEKRYHFVGSDSRYALTFQLSPPPPLR
jgi:hypothetical protein